jgi:hypothetical protein
MRNLRNKRRNPSSVITSEKIRNFVDKFFKQLDKKATTVDSSDYGLDYPNSIVELSEGTYMIGYDPEKHAYFSMFEKTWHGDRETPSDSEFVDVKDNYKSLALACADVAVLNEKERFGNRLEFIEYLLEDAEMNGTY